MSGKPGSFNDSRLMPWTRLILEQLADGQWHERETLLRQGVRLVPPGRALRYAERARRQSGSAGASSPAERATPRSQEFLILVGARRVVEESLIRSSRIERAVHDGVRVIRLAPGGGLRS